MPPLTGGTCYRVAAGDDLGVTVINLKNTAFTIYAVYRVIYDGGGLDEFFVSGTTLNAKSQLTTVASKQVARDGWLIAAYVGFVGTGPNGTNWCWAQLFVNTGEDLANVNNRLYFAGGWVGGFSNLVMGTSQAMDFDATWCFQGTVAEDATVGTHSCSAVISPGASVELQVLGCRIVDGNTATSQTVTVKIDDGSQIQWQPTVASTTAQIETWAAPGLTGIGSATSTAFLALPLPNPCVISGGMNLTLNVATTAVSVTQTFSIMARLKGKTQPTVTLSDAVGSPVLAVHTNDVF